MNLVDERTLSSSLRKEHVTVLPSRVASGIDSRQYGERVSPAPPLSVEEPTHSTPRGFRVNVFDPPFSKGTHTVGGGPRRSGLLRASAIGVAQLSMVAPPPPCLVQWSAGKIDSTRESQPSWWDAQARGAPGAPYVGIFRRLQVNAAVLSACGD